ncbi:MAG: tetratricopeptide repeat protein [Patescibacteria group bacterium]
MGYLKLAWAFIKNWKNIILALLIVGLIGLLGIQTYRIQNIKLEAEKDKVKAYQQMITAQKAHEKRLAKISKETGEISQKIKNLKLNKERCQDEVFYNTANDIVSRFNK